MHNKDMEQQVVVKEIIEETKDTKSFVLGPNVDKGTKELMVFEAGQYISLKVNIDGNSTSRAYSLSSSPKDASRGLYRLTIKRVENGLVSNYMLDKVNVGDEFLVSLPSGVFTYNKVRDESDVIGIAGGSGITPFMSFAKAIDEGSEDCNLTVIYSVKKEEDIIFKEEIEEINKNSKRVKFVITLTDEENDKYLNGRISREMLEPYMKEFVTVFMCGPKGLYKTMNEILASYNIPKKSVHFENFDMRYEPFEVNTYRLEVLMNGSSKRLECKSDETLLSAMEKGEVNAPSMCRVGVCGYCRSVLVSGKVKTVGASQVKALSENDYIHPCVTYPESDIVIKLDI